MKKSLFALLLLAATSAAQAVDTNVGTMDCVTLFEIDDKIRSDFYTESERANATLEKLVVSAWAHGYASAMGKSPNLQTYIGWVSGYCMLNPDKTVLDAILTYFNNKEEN